MILGWVFMEDVGEKDWCVDREHSPPGPSLKLRTQQSKQYATLYEENPENSGESDKQYAVLYRGWWWAVFRVNTKRLSAKDRDAAISIVLAKYGSTDV
jgi:hypothetical protein